MSRNLPVWWPVQQQSRKANCHNLKTSWKPEKKEKSDEKEMKKSKMNEQVMKTSKMNEQKRSQYHIGPGEPGVSYDCCVLCTLICTDRN